MLTVAQRYRQTDGRTTYDSKIALALRASSVKMIGYKRSPMKVTKREMKRLGPLKIPRRAPMIVPDLARLSNDDVDSRRLY